MGHGPAVQPVAGQPSVVQPRENPTLGGSLLQIFASGGRSSLWFSLLGPKTLHFGIQWLGLVRPSVLQPGQRNSARRSTLN